MKIVIDYPPNIEAIKKVVTLNKGIIFTYGDTIYNPDDGYIDAAILAHEEIHEKQQGDDPAGWWVKYLESPEFRLNQELQAYRKQWRVFSKGKDRNLTFKFLYGIAGHLAGAMYGNIISIDEAVKRIKS